MIKQRTENWMNLYYQTPAQIYKSKFGRISTTDSGTSTCQLCLERCNQWNHVLNICVLTKFGQLQLKCGIEGRVL